MAVGACLPGSVDALLPVHVLLYAQLQITTILQTPPRRMKGAWVRGRPKAAGLVWYGGVCVCVCVCVEGGVAAQTEI